MKRQLKIAPSLLAANFANLSADIKKARDGGADLLHLDVMDGLFVPNISFGMPVIQAIRSVTDLKLDTHLMIERPERYIKKFAELGSYYITVHIEACGDIEGTLKKIRDLGAKPSVSLKPGTPVSDIEGVLGLVDMVLVMTVEPGFGGQSYMADMAPKIRRLYELCERYGYSYDIQADGGINGETVINAAEAGVNVFVAGSSVFGTNDYGKSIELLRNNAEKYYRGNN